MMKTPHGFVYAILIIVAILAVTLYGRSQSSRLATTATIRTPPPEFAADNAGTVAKEESGGKETNPKPDDDASK